MNDEQFFAWLDGELDAAAAAVVAAQVAADPDLQRKAAAHQALNAQLKATFAPVASAPIPDAMLEAAGRGMVIDLAAARERKVRRFGVPAAAQWAAMAATLVLGIVTGTMITGETQSPVRTDAGQLIASGELDRALDTRLASAQAASGPRIGLTYRDQAGSICRSFSDGAAQGLACRAGNGWRIRGVFQGANGPTGEFRMAASADPALSALIDSTMSGEPFDATAERRAQAGGWH